MYIIKKVNAMSALIILPISNATSNFLTVRKEQKVRLTKQRRVQLQLWTLKELLFELMEANTAAREGSLKVSFKRSLYEYFFQERDVEDLVEALAGVAHKWEEIAVAVRLPEVVRAECGEKSSLVLKLHSVLYKWIVGGHLNTKPPTVKNLKKIYSFIPDISNQL